MMYEVEMPACEAVRPPHMIDFSYPAAKPWLAKPKLIAAASAAFANVVFFIKTPFRLLKVAPVMRTNLRTKGLATKRVIA